MADRDIKTLALELRSQVSDLERRMDLARKAGQQFGGDREVWKQLGYPQTVQVPFEELLGKWMRQDIAGTIIDAPAEDTWQVEPTIVELDADGERVEDSEFAATVTAIFDRIDAYSKFERVDRLAGIGRYAVAVVGTKNGTDLERPIAEDQLAGPEDILYLSLFHEGDAPVVELDEDPASPRFGKPEMYRVDLIDAKVGGGTDSSRKKKVSVQSKVHWSRIIHVADDLTDDEVFGRPRLERVFNRLADVVKIAGGSAEMFWSNVAGLLHGDIDTELDLSREHTGDSAADVLEDLADRLTELQLKGARRAFVTQGMALSHVGADTPDPRGIFEVLQALIAAATRIPQRILFGSERGELASSQDERAWLGRMQRRQKRFATPVVIGGAIELFTNAGVLELPEGHSWDAEWPDLFRLTDLERSEMASTLALAAQRLTAMGGDPKESVPVALALAEGDVDPEKAEEIAIEANALNALEETESSSFFIVGAGGEARRLPREPDCVTEAEIDGETARVFALYVADMEDDAVRVPPGRWGTLRQAREAAEAILEDEQRAELTVIVGEAIGTARGQVVFQDRVALQWVPEGATA